MVSASIKYSVVVHHMYPSPAKYCALTQIPGHHIMLLIDNCQHTICVRYYCNTHPKRGSGVDNTIDRIEVGCIKDYAKVSTAIVK